MRSNSFTNHELLALLLLLCTRSPPPTLAASPDRSFTIINNCDYTLWPAITNWGTDKQQYTGIRGWEAKGGSSKELKVPSPWNGRIWARRDCEFDSSGNGKCTTGNAEGGIEPKDQTIGYVNVGEFNLDAWGGNDFWDISCVPGWTVTMAIEPEPEDCQSVICADDLNEDCPDDRLKQKDSSGKVIGCLSACMAGINAEDPSINCCSGKYNSKETCPSDQVDFYEVLKPYCQNAYWYPYDFQNNTPTVDWACPTSKNAAYKITFCPEGETTKSDETVHPGGVTFVGDSNGTSTAEPNGGSTGKSNSSETTIASAGDGGGGQTTDGAKTSQRSSTSTGSTQSQDSSSASTTSTNSSPSSSGSNANSTSSSNDSSTDATIFGFPRSTVLVTCAVAGLVIVVLAVVACVFAKGKRSGISRSLPKGKRDGKFDREVIHHDISSSSSEEEEEGEDEEESERRHLRK